MTIKSLGKVVTEFTFVKHSTKGYPREVPYYVEKA